MVFNVGRRAVLLGTRRNAIGMRFSSTLAQGQKTVSPHVSSPSFSPYFFALFFFDLLCSLYFLGIEC
jgi:hypothetical protein